MRARRLICLSCHRDFTRKWNAERHNQNSHFGEAEIISVSQFLYGSPTGQATRRRNPAEPSEDETLDDTIADALESIEKEFEECENTLKYAEPEVKDKLLGQAVFHALGSRNPKQAMRGSLRSLRRGNLNARMIHCVAATLNIPPFVAEQILRKRLESSRLR
jgi:hypothetical protein